jgi:NADPH-dependent 2,4-dienoyl-CoA reductase/sulfur reductase-like enzyme/rhodanese-related sulfurtransferase
MGKATKIVIIGGVAAGAAAATRARRINENAQITIYEKSNYISFANCGMPYYIGGEISNRQRLLLNTPDFFKDRFDVDVFLNHEVVSIDKKAKKITVLDLTKRRKNESEVKYDQLLIATGASHITPEMGEVDAKNVFPLRNISHMDKIKECIETWRPENTIIVGAGYIGLELSEQLKRVGSDVTVVEKADQILPPYDPEMASIVEDYITNNEIKIIKNDSVAEILIDEERAKSVKLESGKELEADMILISAGVRPNVALAKGANLKIGETGGIIVNEKMQTSDSSIFAAGDAVESTHKVSGEKVWVPLAGPASFQGRVAGTVMAGKEATFSGVLGASIVRVNKITAAITGLSENQALKTDIKFYVSYSHSLNHAGYYPGAVMQHIKLIVEKKTGRLLGAQVVGYDGVDKTIDILSAAINSGQTAGDLADMDLAYAPPFSSARSPVQMAGMIAHNRLQGIESTIETDEVIKKGYTVIDVRTDSEHKNDKIFEGSTSIPIDKLRDNLPLTMKSKKIALLCRAGLRSYLGYRIMKQAGFKNVRNINGGYLIAKHILKTK